MLLAFSLSLFLSTLRADVEWIRVAAADSSQEARSTADFTCSGKNDERVVQQAVDRCAETGKNLMLMNGLYLFDAAHPFADGGPDTAVRLTNMHRDFVVQGQGFYTCGGSTQLVNGVVIRVTTNFWNSTGGRSADVLRGQWSPRGIQNGSSLRLRNLAIFLPDHQHPARCVDLRRVDCVEVENLRMYGIGEQTFAGLKYPYKDMGVPIVESIGLTMTDGSNYLTSNYRNVIGKWFGQAIQAGGEHVVCIACAGVFSRYGWTFGNYEANCGLNHPITLINCCDEQNVNLPLLNRCGDEGGRLNGNQELTMVSFNIERVEKQMPGRKAGDLMREVKPGSWGGNITFTLQPAWCQINVVGLPLWQPDGSGSRFVTRNSAHKTVCTSAERRAYAPQFGQLVYDTDLNKQLVCTDPAKRIWRDALGNAVE